MDIGQRIKEKRMQLGLTQEELANRCELTKGYISLLENDKTDPSIQTLMTILDVLGISLADFFKEDKQEKIVYTESEQLDTKYDGYVQSWLIPIAQNKAMEPILQVISSKNKTNVIKPFEGEVFGYVLKGKVNLHIGQMIYSTGCGESFYFNATQEHFVENDTESEAVVLLVATPPNF